MRVITRNSDPNILKTLPVPYEYILRLDCLKYNTLPYPGGWFDQPQYIVACFRIIEDEMAKWDVEKRQIEQRNKQLVDIANAQNPKKSP